MHEPDATGRIDLYVYNEATAWTLSSERLVTEDPIPEDESFDAALRAGRLVAQGIYQDDPFNARIVLGDLNGQESSEWIGRASWWLQVPDGVLVLAAGGEFAWGMAEDLEGEEFIHRVAVPPGNYQVDVYTTLTGINGLSALERAGPGEPLGAWWRRTRPGQEIPGWMQFLLYEGLAADPGHEADWRNWSDSRYRRLMESVEKTRLLDWIIQLRPLAGQPPAPESVPELDEGCFYEPALRIPATCPAGIVAAVVNPPEECLDEPEEPVDALARVEGCERAPIVGGPVTLPAADLYLLARIAWFANRDAEAELLVDGENLGYWVEEQLDPGAVHVRTAPDRRFRLGFTPNEGVHDMVARLQELGSALAALPDGSSLELVTAAGDDSEYGKMRLAGRVSGGDWTILEAFPETGAPEIEAALRLAREAAGDTLTLQEEAEQEAVLERWRDEGMQRVAPLEAGNLVLSHDEGGRFTYLVAATVFAIRHGETWPCPEPEDPLAELPAEFGDDPDAALVEMELPETDPLLQADSGRAYFELDEDDIPPAVLERTQSLHDDFLAAGAVAVGDLVCSFSPGVLIRGFADRQAQWFGTIMVAPYMPIMPEAYTTFVDGSSITTTTNPSPGGSAAGSRIHWNIVPTDAGLGQVLAAHGECVRKFASEHATEPVLIRQNLLALCEAIEAFLVRRTG